MPNPNAQAINLSDRQRKQLEHIGSRTTNAYRLVTRAKVILGAAGGINNTELSHQLQLHRRRKGVATAMAGGGGATGSCGTKTGK